MASIFDEARKKIEEILNAGKVTYANPAGQNFKPLINAQQIAQVASNPALNRVAGELSNFNTINNLPRFQLPEVQTQSPIFNAVANFTKAIPESILNIPRNLTVGVTRTGTEIGQSLRDQRALNLQNLAGGVAPLAESIFDVASFGLGKNIIKEGGKQVLKQGTKQAIKSGAIRGAEYGAFGGATYGVDMQYGKEFSVGEVAQSILAGTILGSAIGGGLSGLGAIKQLITRAPQVEQQLRDKMGRWVAGETPTKPNGMPKAQWDFQLKFNRKYNRNPYTPVMPGDLQSSIQYESSKRVGFQARDINKDRNPLGAKAGLYDTKLFSPPDDIQAFKENILNPTNLQRNLDELAKDGIKPDENGLITLYRGQSRKDNSQFRAFSYFSTNPELAKRFGGTVHTVKVNPQDLVITNRMGEGITFQNPVNMVRVGEKYVIDPTDISNVAQQPLSVKPTQASKGVEATSSQLGKGQNLSRTPEDFGRISPQELKQSQSRILGKAQSDLPPSTPNVPSNVVPPSPSSIDPVSKITEALKQAKPIRAEQEALYSKARSQQSGALAGIGKELGGEQTYYRKLSQLKGELPKAQFESIKNQLGQADIDSLFNKVEQSVLSPFEKVTAQTGLRKLLGEGGGVVPTKGELSLLGEIFPPEFIQAVMQNRSTFQKLLSLTEGTLNLPRAVMATADLSAPMRQGIFLVGRPKQFVPAFKDMFKFAFNENSYKGFMESVKVRPTYPLMRQAKLALTDMGPNLLKREESFMSNLVEKIPGFGKIAQSSNRAYSGFLNKLRADVFDDLVGKASSQGIKMEGKTLTDLGSFINSATGRGNLPQAAERFVPVLNSVFFSPRLMASRINLLNPVYYAKLDPFVRKEALKSLLGFGGTALTVLGLAKLGGAEVGDDPRSSDFGKIKVGNTRYDVLGGFQQYIKLSAQLLSGQVVSSTTGKVMTLGEGYKPLTRKDIIMRFFESKESPVASFITAMATGQNGMGEEVNVPSEVISRFIPLVVQDMYDITKDKDSVAQGLIMAAPGFFGIGSQTYGKQELVTGKNKIGQETMQTRPVPDLPTAISDKLFGTKPLGTSTSYSVDAYYKQLKAMPREQAAQIYDQIAKTNPDLAKQINQVIKDEQKGITVADQTLKGKGVASGDRATAIAGEFKKLQTQEEKADLWDDYVRKGIITKEVAQQLAILAKRGEL